ncbi:MAG: hypoxanthine phosphoribosyltransferase [Alphaproteobacteria bacterium]
MSEKRSIPVLYTAAEIAERVEAIAAEISVHMPPDFLMVSLLRGSFVFTADLARDLCAIGVHPQIDFMTLTSYGQATTSSGTVNINRDISEEVKDKAVLIVDDILETGRTLHFAQTLLKARGAALIKTAVLLEKPGHRIVDVKADMVGFAVPDKFVVGYGLDYANHYRELPFIGYLDVH